MIANRLEDYAREILNLALNNVISLELNIPKLFPTEFEMEHNVHETYIVKIYEKQGEKIIEYLSNDSGTKHDSYYGTEDDLLQNIIIGLERKQRADSVSYFPTDAVAYANYIKDILEAQVPKGSNMALVLVKDEMLLSCAIYSYGELVYIYDNLTIELREYDEEDSENVLKYVFGEQSLLPYYNKSKFKDRGMVSKVKVFFQPINDDTLDRIETFATKLADLKEFYDSSYRLISDYNKAHQPENRQYIDTAPSASKWEDQVVINRDSEVGLYLKPVLTHAEKCLEEISTWLYSARYMVVAHLVNIIGVKEYCMKEITRVRLYSKFKTYTDDCVACIGMSYSNINNLVKPFLPTGNVVTISDFSRVGLSYNPDKFEFSIIQQATKYMIGARKSYCVLNNGNIAIINYEGNIYMIAKLSEEKELALSVYSEETEDYKEIPNLPFDFQDDLGLYAFLKEEGSIKKSVKSF